VASIETICTPAAVSSAASSVITGTLRHRLQVRRPVLPPRRRGHPDAHHRGLLRHVDPRDDLIAQLVVLILHHLRAHPPLLSAPASARPPRLRILDLG